MGTNWNLIEKICALALLVGPLWNLEKNKFSFISCFLMLWCLVCFDFINEKMWYCDGVDVVAFVVSKIGNHGFCKKI